MPNPRRPRPSSAPDPAPEIVTATASPMTPEFRIGMLRSRCEALRSSVLARLRVDMRNLRERLNDAARRLDEGHPIDAYLIVNAASMTAEIERWNLMVDLMPLVGTTDRASYTRTP